MTGAIDPRTAARAEALRATCKLPITRVHGLLVGRSGGFPWSVAMEPGGRHAAVMVRGGVERWDLDALECVGRWPLPRDRTAAPAPSTRALHAPRSRRSSRWHGTHVLRKTCGTRIADGGGGGSAVASHLRHKNLQTASRYIDRRGANSRALDALES